MTESNIFKSPQNPTNEDIEKLIASSLPSADDLMGDKIVRYESSAFTTGQRGNSETVYTYTYAFRDGCLELQNIIFCGNKQGDDV